MLLLVLKELAFLSGGSIAENLHTFSVYSGISYFTIKSFYIMSF